LQKSSHRHRRQWLRLRHHQHPRLFVIPPHLMSRLRSQRQQSSSRCR
jgi:hypothetical protein